MAMNQPSTLITTQLQDVLACLDLSLEAELALYRRQQRPAESPLAVLPGSATDERLQAVHPEMEQFGSTGSEPKASEPEKPTIPATGSLLNRGGLESDGERQEIPTASPPAPTENIAASVEIANTQTGRAPGAEDAEPPPSAAALAPLPIEDEPETLPEPYDAALTAQPEAFERFLDPSIEDYLESSEALLKHLNDPQEQTETPKPQKAAPLWPLALRAILGLVAIAAFAALAIALISQWFAPKPREVVPQPQPPVKSPAAQSQPPAVSQKPANPLAQPTVTPATSNTTSTQSSATIPAMSPSIPPLTTPAATVSPSPSAYYLVVAPYSGEASLAQAKQRVPDAFVEVVQGQQRIQLGLLETREQAQQLVKELKNQDFSSSILAGPQRQ